MNDSKNVDDKNVVTNQKPKGGELNESSLWEKIGSIYEIYFQPADLSTRMRFLWAWLGSLTLYMPIFTFEPDVRNALAKTPMEFWQAIDFDLLMIITIVLCLSSSLVIGGMLATSNNRYGPVRLYLSGLMLSSFVVIVVVSAYQLWFAGSADNAALFISTLEKIADDDKLMELISSEDFEKIMDSGILDKIYFYQ